MVLLHVKRGDESQFLLQAPGSTELEELTVQVARVYNGRLKVQRLCSEMEELAEHGIFLPPNMQGLTDDQIEELKLKDEWGEKCVPSGGAVFKKDDIGRRNGQAPNEKMKQVLKKTIEEAKAIISKKQVEAGVCVTMEMVKDALDQLRGAVMIVYPMGLPPYDPIRMEFENKEDLSGTQAGLNVIKEAEAQLWWAAKELRRTKKLSDYVGKNEKTKIIAKIQQILPLSRWSFFVLLSLGLALWDPWTRTPISSGTGFWQMSPAAVEREMQMLAGQLEARDPKEGTHPEDPCPGAGAVTEKTAVAAEVLTEDCNAGEMPPLQQQVIRLHQELGRQKSLWADVHGKLRSHIDALREQNMELREKLRALQLQRWKARKKSAASPHAGQELHTLALEPAFGKMSPLSADEETIPKYIGRKNQSATLLGQFSSSKANEFKDRKN
ncbi:cilia- and flagella-associated protein 298 isoform X2 [Pan paniscus]|uniref:cilia- and flagella-associated protein 298 isoform X2 n=1 Tax=Pan paniscus TaxID=9597 RepID=UPI00156071F3|nr:cilia- and flagella-associated protein 298 isoform X2 [Pan paniscus]